jgi:transposase
MLTLMPNVRVFVCTQATDMRKSFDGLSGMVEEVVQQSPLSGHLFVFRNRRGDKLKVLYWAGDGLCIWAKRLEAGTFELPVGQEGGLEISRAELNMLLDGVALDSRRRPRFNLARAA